MLLFHGTRGDRDRAQLSVTDDRARVEGRDDVATLDRWCENVLGAKTIAEVLS